MRDLFAALPNLHMAHDPGGPVHAMLSGMAEWEADRRFGELKGGLQDFGPFGHIIFPYEPLGKTSTLNLFGLDELIIFAFYWVNRHRYDRVADIGANRGLHSLVLDRCGYRVRAYEPDPEHFKALAHNLKVNMANPGRVEVIQAAVSSRAGFAEMVRVLDNTTGNHLEGMKVPYGPTETFGVRLVPFWPIVGWADLVKIDAEGHEAEILTSCSRFEGTDIIVEVGSRDNARAIWRHFEGKANLFPQRLSWKRATSADDLPASWKDGSLFISTREEMPW